MDKKIIYYLSTEPEPEFDVKEEMAVPLEPKEFMLYQKHHSSRI